MPLLFCVDVETHILRTTNAATSETTSIIKLPAAPLALSLSPLIPDAARSMAIVSEKDVTVVNPATFDVIRKLECVSAACAVFSSDGLFMAIGGANLTVFSQASYDLIAERKEQVKAIRAMCFSPSSDTLATTCIDRTIVIWSLPGFERAGVLKGHRDAINALIFIDNTRLVSASDDKSIRAWDIPASSCVKEIVEHGSHVACLALSPDRALIASGSSDKTVRVYSASTLKCSKVIKCAKFVRRIAFVDQDSLAVACYGCEMVTVSISTGLPVAKYARLSEPTGLVVLE